MRKRLSKIMIIMLMVMTLTMGITYITYDSNGTERYMDFK